MFIIAQSYKILGLLLEINLKWQIEEWVVVPPVFWDSGYFVLAEMIT